MRSTGNRRAGRDPTGLPSLHPREIASGAGEFREARHQLLHTFVGERDSDLFIVIARVAYRLIGDEARALGAVSVVSGTLGVLAIAAFFRKVSASDPLATTLAVTRCLPLGAYSRETFDATTTLLTGPAAGPSQLRSRIGSR